MSTTTFLGEVEKNNRGQVTEEMRDFFLDHYSEHRHEGCKGYHSCGEFLTMRRNLAAIRANDGCPKCGGELVERTNRKTGEPFTGCSNFPTCNYSKNSGGLHLVR